MRWRTRFVLTEAEAQAVLGAIKGTIEDYTASGSDAPRELETASDAIKRALARAKEREAASDE